MKTKRTLSYPAVAASLGLATAFFFAMPARFAAAEDFYAGKTIRIIAGFTPGGTIDLRARLFARHVSRWIPGNPSVIVQSMPGAGGIIASNYALAAAKPDGLTLLHHPSGLVLNPFLHPGGVRYEIRKVRIFWSQSDSWVTAINPKTTQIGTAKQLLRTTLRLAVGGSGVASVRTLRPKLAMELFGVKHTLVTGYGGSAALIAAMDRGEIHLFEEPVSGYPTTIQPREKEGTAAVLWQTGTLTPEGSFQRFPLFPNVPTLDEVLPDERKAGRAWEAWKAAVVPLAFQSMVALPPGVPSDRVETFVRAFKSMEEDRAYREEWHKIFGATADAHVGKEAERVVRAGLKQLEDFHEGVQYLRQLSGSSGS